MNKNMVRENQDGFLYSLQTLRAIAAISVLYFHIETNPRFGSFGVDIFFVISGFVMASIVANGQAAKDFLINRVSRIVPLYWLLTTGVLFIALVKPELLNSTTANGVNYLKSLFFIPYQKENGALHPMLAVGWTLNYEMFFYLCVWVSLIFLRKKGLVFGLVCFLMFFTFFVGAFSKNPVVNGFFGSSLLFEFLLGFFVYYIYGKCRKKIINQFLLMALVFLSYIIMAYIEVVGMVADRFFIYGVPSAVLVASGIFLEKNLFSQWGFFTRFFSGIGNASYATYLSHFYIVEGMRKIIFPKIVFLSMNSFLGTLFVMLISLVVGQLIYGFFDKPLNYYFRKKLNQLWLCWEHRNLCSSEKIKL